MAMKLGVSLPAALAAAVMALWGSAIHAAEVRVLAANAIKEPLLELVSAFEGSSGHRVTVIWGGTEGIARRIDGGELADIVIIAAPGIDKLVAAGKLLTGKRVDLARSGVGIAVRSGLPKPDVSSAQAVKRAVLAATSIAYSSGPSGFYLAELFKGWGIAEEIRHKLTQPASGVQVGELIARGEADLGFQQISELVHVRGIDYLGPLPAEIQTMTVYSAGLHTAAPVPDAAEALLRFLSAPAAESVYRNAGMEPG